MILQGRVAVNDRVITELGTQVDPAVDLVFVNGEAVAPPADEKVYIALHKPRGYVTSCSHPGERIVLDLVDVAHRVYPVGRLDKDSTGLLLLTNDGQLHHRLSHPSFDHEKEYDVTVDRPIPDDALAAMASGMALGKTRTRPARLRRLAPERFLMVLQEGQNRQIRRMVAKLGWRVRALKRIRMAHIRLGNLRPGAWRLLNDAEVRKLIKAIEGPPSRPRRQKPGR